MLFVVLLFGLFEILCQLAQTAIMLVVLAAVEANYLALLRHAHRHHLVGYPVEAIGYHKSIDKDNSHCNKVIYKELQMRNALSSKVRLIFIDENAR